MSLSTHQKDWAYFGVKSVRPLANSFVWIYLLVQWLYHATTLPLKAMHPAKAMPSMRLPKRCSYWRKKTRAFRITCEYTTRLPPSLLILTLCFVSFPHCYSPPPNHPPLFQSSLEQTCKAQKWWMHCSDGLLRSLLRCGRCWVFWIILREIKRVSEQVWVSESELVSVCVCVCVCVCCEIRVRGEEDFLLFWLKYISRLQSPIACSCQCWTSEPRWITCSRAVQAKEWKSSSLRCSKGGKHVGKKHDERSLNSSSWQIDIFLLHFPFFLRPCPCSLPSLSLYAGRKESGKTGASVEEEGNKVYSQLPNVSWPCFFFSPYTYIYVHPSQSYSPPLSLIMSSCFLCSDRKEAAALEAMAARVEENLRSATVRTAVIDIYMRI